MHSDANANETKFSHGTRFQEKFFCSLEVSAFKLHNVIERPLLAHTIYINIPLANATSLLYCFSRRERLLIQKLKKKLSEEEYFVLKNI